MSAPPARFDRRAQRRELIVSLLATLIVVGGGERFAVAHGLDAQIPAGAVIDTVTVTVESNVDTAPTYDDNGNMTSDGSYGNRTYTYDTLGRLTGVSGNGVTAAYGLDGAGNRWSQTIDSTTTSFDLDLLAANPTILFDGTNKYLPGAPAFGRETGGTWYSGLTDLVGTPLSLVDTAGNVTAATHFDPFGAPRTGYSAAPGIGFAGEYRDPTGLTNLRFRSYDPCWRASSAARAFPTVPIRAG